MLATRDPADLEGVAVHLYRATKRWTTRVRRCRRRAADRPAAGRARASTPSSGGSTWRRARSRVVPRGVKFRVEVDGEARGYVAENYGRRSACPNWARSAPTASPIRAISRCRPPGSRTATSRPRWSRNISAIVDDDARPFAARRRRLARQLRAVPLRSGALQHDRHGQLRPSRPVDLHRADLARATCPAAPMPIS